MVSAPTFSCLCVFYFLCVHQVCYSVVSLMSCESTIYSSSACFFGHGSLWISVACFALSIYAHYPCRLACLSMIFFRLWFFGAMLDSLTMPSFDSTSSPYGCVSFSDAPSVALSLIYALSFASELLLLRAFVLWSFVTCCSSSGRLLAYVDLFFVRLWFDSPGLKTLHAMTTLKMRILDYLFLLLVLPFFKCNAIAYALHLRGVLRSISIGLGL
jgi:hypothetical protein